MSPDDRSDEHLRHLCEVGNGVEVDLESEKQTLQRGSADTSLVSWPRRSQPTLFAERLMNFRVESITRPPFPLVYLFGYVVVEKGTEFEPDFLRLLVQFDRAEIQSRALPEPASRPDARRRRVPPRP